MRGSLGKGLEDPAEVKGAHQAMSSKVLQGDVVGVMFGNVLLGQLDGGEVLLFEAGMDAVIGCVVGYGAQNLVHHFQYQVIDLQFAAGTGKHQPGNVEMQKLRFGCCFIEGRVEVMIGEESSLSVLQQNLLIEWMLEFEDGTFIGNAMGMRYRAFASGFGDEYATRIGVERATKNIEQEISFAYKADAESLIVFRFGSAAIHAPAFEIHDAVKGRLVQCIDVGIHTPQGTTIRPGWAGPKGRCLLQN